MNEQEFLDKLNAAVSNLNNVLDELSEKNVFVSLGMYGQETSSGFNNTRSVVINDVVRTLKPLPKGHPRRWG